jgi:uncharacterized damage-inducible protein DinB
MNPYAIHLEGSDPLSVIAETPQRLAKLLKSLDAKTLDTPPAPDKWSIRKIMAHLADCEVVFGFRFRQTVAQPHHTVQAFDQELWAKQYQSYDTASALKTFTAVRKWNLLFLASLPKEDFGKPVTHPERGDMTLQIMVETMAGHDRNHLKHIERLAENHVLRASN